MGHIEDGEAVRVSAEHNLFGDSSGLRTSFETHFDFHGQLRLSRALKVGTELFFVLVSPPA